MYTANPLLVSLPVRSRYLDGTLAEGQISILGIPSGIGFDK